MITQLVRQNKIPEYESWLRGIHAEIRNAEGFSSADIIRPTEGSEPEYVVLLKFEDVEVSRTWTRSKEQEIRLEKLPTLVKSRTESQQEMGMEIWLQRPRQNRSNTCLHNARTWGRRCMTKSQRSGYDRYIYLQYNASIQNDAMKMGDPVYLSEKEFELLTETQFLPLTRDRAWEYFCARAEKEMV